MRCSSQKRSMKELKNACQIRSETSDKFELFQATADPISSYHGSARPVVCGKFLYCNDQKLCLRGVTYGTFRPDKRGREFHDPDREIHGRVCRAGMCRK